jgi:lysyl-tRNA synthetase class 1
MKYPEQRMEETERTHWADSIASNLISSNPKQKKFVCAAGISPSGIIHIGNFRDIITSDLVCRALRDKGYDAKLIFSWDEYDRLRKIPKGVPEEFTKYLGMPLADVPDPYKCHKTYARHFQTPFEESIPELGIPINFIYQAEKYKKNEYYEGIKTAMQKRKQIAEMLAKFKTQGMTKKEMDEYYPLQVYCEKCNRGTTTKIIDYDGEDKVIYKCECGHKETADISKKNIGKLDWKVDWPMRWKHEGVNFEPGGEDHATPGGSFDVSSKIAKQIYGIEPPYFQGYGFVGVEGTYKMSGSKGTGIAPKDLLEIYEPELLRWLFTRVNPTKTLTLFFDSQIIRQYDEFDREVLKYKENKLSPSEKRALEFANINPKKPLVQERVPFRQIGSFGQVAQGNFKELKNIYERIGEKYPDVILKQRLIKSQNWIDKFALEFKIHVRDKPNNPYYKNLTKEEREQINKFKNEFEKYWNLEDLTTFVYAIPKKPGMTEDEKKVKQRGFFKNVYQMLIDADTGPRLPTFLLALGKEKVKKLLTI